MHEQHVEVDNRKLKREKYEAKKDRDGRASFLKTLGWETVYVYDEQVTKAGETKTFYVVVFVPEVTPKLTPSPQGGERGEGKDERDATDATEVEIADQSDQPTNDENDEKDEYATSFDVGGEGGE